MRAVALRSLKAPGTAYDDPRLGRDPQPGSMDDYVRTQEDEGGVHINSGIPNRAFQLLAVELGGAAWERAGRIWYDAVTGPGLHPDAGFADFARATPAAARARFGEGRCRRRWPAPGSGSGSRSETGRCAPDRPGAGDTELTPSQENPSIGHPWVADWRPCAYR